MSGSGIGGEFLEEIHVTNFYFRQEPEAEYVRMDQTGLERTGDESKYEPPRVSSIIIEPRRRVFLQWNIVDGK